MVYKRLCKKIYSQPQKFLRRNFCCLLYLLVILGDIVKQPIYKNMNNTSIKRNSIFIGIIILISIYLLREDILGNKVQFAGDARDQFLADKIVIRNSLYEGSLPLWSPFLMGGEPLLAKTQLGVISINSLLEFIMPNVYTTMLVNALIHLIILGIGMYFLARTVNLEPRFALISSIVCMLSSYVTSSIFYVTFQFVGLAFAPYVIMFTIKGIRNKEWIKYGVLAGVFLSLQFLEGAFEVFTFSAMIVVYILLFHLIGRNFIGRLIKSSLLGIIIIVVAIGISAIKFLPAIENANASQRQQPYDYETSLGSHITFKYFFPTLIDSRSITEPLKHPIKGTGNVEIGVLSAILILISIPNFKKKNYLLFLGLLIFGILMITDSPLVYALWKYFPYFNKQKHVIKAEFIFLLSASVLTAYGVYYLLSRIKSKKTSNFVYVTLVSLLIITSWGATYEVRMKKPYMELESVDIMKYMGEDKDMFRFKAYETNGIDWGTNYYSIYYN
ncbi:MAG: hypothetical protein AABY14_04720, partial [Nanoarchaeota archaeon]